MKSITIALVLFAGRIWAADEAADRAGIESTIRAFSVMPGRPGLFSSDFDPDELVRYGRAPGAESGAIRIAIDGVPGEVVISKEPMGEAAWFPVWFPAVMHAPMVITIKRIRFVTPDVAMVDGIGNGAVLIVMKKVGTDWKIASLRRLAEN